MVGRGGEGQLVHLGEVADVRIGAENERNVARANTVPAVSLGIEQLSKANTLDVSRGVRAEIERILPDLPEGMSLQVNYDRADFISASMRQVLYALGFAITLVLLVIYLFLGDLRATLIPAAVVPISVISTFMVMAAFGYTVNTLTLLGLVLAIGLVVDDAIVVLENIYRHIEEGHPPLLAALEGSKEIGFAVIATTLVLVAVFVPLSFIQGDIRTALQRVWHHPGRCGDLLEPRRAHALADDGLEAAALVHAGREQRRARGSSRRWASCGWQSAIATCCSVS